MKNSKRQMHVESLETRRLMAFDPTALEQEMLQLINRFKSDPTGEYGRLIASDSPLRSFDAEVTSQLDFSKVDGGMLRSELSRLSPVPPVAWNEVVYDIATTQNGTMIAKQRQEHFPNLASTLNGLGVPIEAGTAQNAFFNTLNIGKTPFFVHASYVIDWAAGAPDAVGGMQKDRGHRANLANSLYNQIGSAITPTSILVSTQMFAKISSAQKMAVGALFEDKNKSGWYDAGEGLGGAKIEFKNQASGAIITTTALSAGGYQVVLPAGTYSATASGGALKHAVVIPSVTINSSNVWQNIIYDPTAIPPDAMEPNNSTTAAKDLGGRDQTLNSLSIHPGDVDYFKFTSDGTGSATFNLRFTQADGNLDLRLLNSSGAVIASAVTTSAPESIATNVTRGQTYYVQVFSNTNASNGQYSLQLDLPQPAAPSAKSDRGITAHGANALQLRIVDNDTDPDSSSSTLTPSMQSSGTGGFTINNDRTLSYTPNAGYVGIDRGTYKLTDDQGLSSNNAEIEVLVLDFTTAKPWYNVRRPLDVNDDGNISPVDALLVINAINTRGSKVLPTSLATANGLFGFVDSSGDGSLAPIDALLVINEINRTRSGGEGESRLAIDIALQQIVMEDERSLKRSLRR
jgi:Bacterial Ig domain/Dockerin type I domain